MSNPQLICPMCDAVLQFRSALTPGAHTRCPRCGTPFSLDAPSLSPPPMEEPVAPRRDDARPATLQPPARRPVVSRDPDDDPAAPPRRAADQPAAGMSPLLIAGAAGGSVAALALIIGLFLWGLGRGPNYAQATGPGEPLTQPAADTRPRDPPRTEPAKEPKPAGEPAPPGESALPVEVLRRVKAATLYVKVRMGDGREATGSGFFEQSTGLILTNAHVVGMLREGAPPPRKVEVVVNSGADGETSLPAELVSVDRDADLALLRVQLSAAQSNAFPMLPVAPAKDLLETQPVYVIGFPFGEKVNRGVTVSATSVSSIHRSSYGELTKVQVNGGMHPGNSGGPVIDGRGNVVGVAVAGIVGTQIDFAIPGEAVLAFIDGRVAEVHVATDAVVRNGKLVVPVRILAIDPRKRIGRIALDYWSGPDRPAPLPPSDQPPKLGNLTTPRRTVDVTYDADRREGKAELVLDAMPARGMQLWVQPVVTNGGGEAVWLAGVSYTLAPPVEEKPAVLATRQRIGKGSALLTTSARFKLENRSGREQTYVQDISTRLSEQTLSVGTDGARVRLTVEKFDAGVKLNGSAVETSKQFKTATGRDVAAMFLDFRVDTKGNLTSKKTDLSRVPVPSREILKAIGEQMQQSFDIVAVPQPGEVKPGDTWQAKRELPLEMPDSFQTALMNVTYTYRGLREHDGRQVAVLELRGTLVGDRGNETLAAKMTGSALIDQTTGIVVKANALTDAALTIRVRDETIYASGTLDVRLTREVEEK